MPRKTSPKIFFILIGLIFSLSLKTIIFKDNLSAEEEAATVKAPLFTLPTLENIEVSLEDYRGKFVLLNFWASWCGPCRKEMPSLERLNLTLQRENFVVLGITIDKKKELAKKFIQEYHLTFTNLFDPKEKVSRALYNVAAIPTTFLIDSEGMIIGGSPGARDWATPGYLNFFRRKMRSVGKKREKIKKKVVYEEITIEELQKKIKNKEKFILLDVRTREEFKRGYIQGALNIPLRELKGRINELDRRLEIVVYCARGTRSKKGSKLLAEHSFKKIKNMSAGYEGWKKRKR